jgi:flagellar M-ring protein FliF
MANEAQSIPQVLARLKQFFLGLTLNQRVLMAGGAILVAGVLWLFVALLGQPKYVTLYSGLRTEEAQTLGSRLAAKNIPHQVSTDGSSVLVPEEKLDSSRLETAASGLPRSARLGFELFDTPNWAGSDFTEKVNYQRALEGELERTLATLSEVEAVRVHLVMAQESVFTEQQHEAKAAVILKTHSGHLSQEAQQAIPELVASAVDRLRPENVTVVDADTNTPLLGNRNGSRGSQSYRLDEELVQTLIHTIEPVVGPNHVRASVHVEYDLGSSEETQETYDPKTAVALTQEHSEESSIGAAPAGVPGTASNVPSGTTTPTAAGSAEQSTSRSDATTYAVSKTLHHTVEPPGRIRRVAAAVLVDDAIESSEDSGKPTTKRRKRTAEEMKQIEQLAQAAIGVDSQRGDVLVVENLSFEQAPAERIVSPTRTEAVRRSLERWTWALRYLGLAALFLVVYWLVLRPVKKQAVAAFRELPARVGARLNPHTVAAGGATDVAAAAAGGNRAAELKRLLTDKVKAEPESASRLVQSWVQQEVQR